MVNCFLLIIILVFWNSSAQFFVLFGQVLTVVATVLIDIEFQENYHQLNDSIQSSLPRLAVTQIEQRSIVTYETMRLLSFWLIDLYLNVSYKQICKSIEVVPQFTFCWSFKDKFV